MLDLAFVRDNLELVKQKMRERGFGSVLEGFESVDRERRKFLVEAERGKARRNKVSEQIAALKKQGQDATALIAEMRQLGDEIKRLDEQASGFDERLRELLRNIPNVPHESVPLGTSSHDNQQIRRWGEPREFDFEPKAHWDLGPELGILDFERAAKIAGARFAVYKGLGAKLERALANFMLDVQSREHGYREVVPPFMVNTRTMTGTGQLPKFQSDLFKVEGTDYWLIPTAEVPLTNLHAGETLDEEMLPLRYTAYTPCFRSEAGSYGKDVRGLIRLHQFNKVELVSFARPEESHAELERLTDNAEEILRRLGLAHRVVALSTGDLGFSSARTYDLEVGLPSDGGSHREISSCSNCEAFQARRAGIRMRRRGKSKTELVHTLNGSGLAVGRTLVAILENYQQEDGSVIVPTALRPWMDGLEKIA